MTDAYLVMILLVVTALGLALFPFAGPVGKVTTSASAVDPTEKVRSQLNELLYDYKMGKMSVADYEELKAKLESRLATQPAERVEKHPPKGGRMR